MPEECVAELNAKEVHTLLTTDAPTGIGQIMKTEDFSSISHLCQVSANVLRFVKALKSHKQSCVFDIPSTLSLSAKEISEAERMWIIESQNKLRGDKNFNIWTRLFQDESKVWRCGGRLSNANICFTTKHPIFLNKDHYLTSLTIRNAHQHVSTVASMRL